MELRNAPFLEASRRNSKEGGTKSQEVYKGAQDAKSWSSWWSSCVGGFVFVGVGGFFLVGIFGSWWPVCGEAVRGTTRSSELAVGGESGHGTRDMDGRRRFASSVAQACGERRRELAGPVEGPSQPRLSKLPWGTDVATRPSMHHEGAGNLQRSRGARSVIQAPRHKGLRTLSGALVFGGSLFFSFE